MYAMSNNVLTSLFLKIANCPTGTRPGQFTDQTMTVYIQQGARKGNFLMMGDECTFQIVPKSSFCNCVLCMAPKKQSIIRSSLGKNNVIVLYSVNASGAPT